MTCPFLLLKATDGSELSWLGFPLVGRKAAPCTRRELTQDWSRATLARDGSLEKTSFVSQLIATFRIVMESIFLIGVHPGLGRQAIECMLDTFQQSTA